jgi:WD40 repeat protein
MRMYPQFGHVYDVYCAAISPNGRFLLSGSRDESVRLWDLQSGVLLHTFDGDAEVRAVVFSPDGKQAIAGDDRGYVSAWDLASKKKLISFHTHGGSIEGEALGVLPDGRRVITGHAGNNLHVSDLTNGTVLRVLGGDEKQYRNNPSHVRAEADSLAILPDGRHVLGGYQSGRIKMWDTDAGTLVWELDAHSGPVHSLSTTKDGAYLYSASNDGLKKWQLANRQLIRHYSDLPWVWTIRLASDAKKAWLAYGGTGAFLPNTNRVALLDLESGKAGVGNAMNSPHFTSAASITPDGRIAVAGDEHGNIAIFGAERGELRNTLRGSAGIVNDVAVSPSGLRIATVSMDNNIHLWDAEQIAITSTLQGHTAWPNTAVFSPSGSSLLSSSRSQDFVRLWDLTSHRNVMKFDPGGTAKPMHSSSIAFISNGRRVVTSNMKCEVRIFDIADQRPTATFQLGQWCGPMSVTKDERRLLIGVEADICVHDIATGALISKIRVPTNAIDEIAVSPDGIHAAVAMPNGVHLVDLNAGRVTRSYTQVAHTAPAFSPDGRLLAAASRDRPLTIWEVASGNVTATYPGHKGKVASMHFSASGRQLVSAAQDGTTKIWNRETGEAVTLLVRDAEWLAYSEDGYFDASRRGGELAAIVSGTEGFRIDQLALRNNRPDILLDRIGVANSPLKAHFRALHEQRLRKAGLTEEALSRVYSKAPDATVVRLDQNGKFVSVRFTISDSQYDLASYNVYVNDVPILGSSGKATSGRNQTIDERVELTSGRNKIEVSALNRAGVESLRDDRVVTYTPTVPGDLYYLGFGVSEYRDPALALKFAAKDATDLEALLRSAAGFRAVHTRTFVNAQVTVNSIKQAKEFLRPSKVDDTVLLFVAGHGLYGGHDSAEYYYVTYDTDLRRLEATAANFESIENLLQAIAPRRKLFLIDTCQSGEASNEPSQGAAGFGDLGLVRSRGFRTKEGRPQGGAAALSNLGNDRSRFIYNDLFRRSGAIVLSSSRGSEPSYERDDLQNGVFTEVVLNALSTKEGDANRDGRISTDELRDYVISRVPRISQGLQHPVVDRDNLDMLFSLPLMSPVQ